MSDKPFKDPWHPEQDRLWKAHDDTSKAMQALEARVLALETDPRQQRIDKLTVDLERPTRQVGDYLPDPLPWTGNAKPWQGSREQVEPEYRLTAIRAILSEMREPVGVPSPAQRLLLRIKAVVG